MARVATGMETGEHLYNFILDAEEQPIREVAKSSPADIPKQDGIKMGIVGQSLYRSTIFSHEPRTDAWCFGIVPIPRVGDIGLGIPRQDNPHQR